jgi:hypothetical protein
VQKPTTTRRGGRKERKDRKKVVMKWFKDFQQPSKASQGTKQPSQDTHDECGSRIGSIMIWTGSITLGLSKV